MSMSLDAVPQTLDALDAWLWKHGSTVFIPGDRCHCVLAQYFTDHAGLDMHVTTQEVFFSDTHIKTPGMLLSPAFLLIRVLFDKRWRGHERVTGYAISNRIIADAKLIHLAYTGEDV